MSKWVVIGASALAVLLVFLMGKLALTGVFLGSLLFLAIWLLVVKLPKPMKKLVHKHPLAADLVLTGAATAGVSSFFGPGLTLGLAGIVAGVLVSLALKLDALGRLT